MSGKNHHGITHSYNFPNGRQTCPIQVTPSEVKRILALNRKGVSILEGCRKVGIAQKSFYDAKKRYGL